VLEALHLNDANRRELIEATVGPRRNHAVWLGVLVSAGGMISYFLVFVRFPALRDVPWLNLSMVLIGLSISVWALTRRRTLWSVGGLALSALCAAFLVAYVFVISSGLPSTRGVVAVGEAAPAFALSDHDGATVRLADLAGNHVVLVFYRGFW